MQAVTLSRILPNEPCQVTQISISKYFSKGFTLKLKIITQCYDSDVNSVKLRIDSIVICSFSNQIGSYLNHLKLLYYYRYTQDYKYFRKEWNKCTYYFTIDKQFYGMWMRLYLRLESLDKQASCILRPLKGK